MNVNVKVKVNVKEKMVGLSGSLRTNERKRVGAHHELSNRRRQLQVAARRTDAFDLQSGRVVTDFSGSFWAISKKDEIELIEHLYRRKLGYVTLFRLIRASRRLNHTSNCDQACEQSQLGRNCRLQLLVAT